MSSKVAMALFSALPTPIVQREAVLPLLQFLAWDKMNREHPELKLPDITTAADASDCRSEIRNGLEALQRHSKLFENHEAFTVGALKFAGELPEAALRRVLQAGTKLQPFSQAIMEACLKASQEVNTEASGSNPDYKKVWASLHAFRNEEYFWWQVAEFSYDNFMIRTGVRV